MAESDRTASLMSPARLAKGVPKPAASPAAWLNQMAADAGHMHVRRIGELGALLEEQVVSAELAALASQLERLATVLPRLDFALLEPGSWWARTTGRSRSNGTEFTGQFEFLEEATRPVVGLAATLRQEQQADAALVERALVELEVEYRAVEKIIDQGARWLQDMRTQLKLRQAAAAASVQDQHQVLEDSRRCDILVDRLKMLRALCNTCARVLEQARTNVQERLSLSQSLQQSLAADLKNWHGRVSAVAAAATSGKGPTLGLQGPIDCHNALMSSVGKAVSECGQLQAQQQTLVQCLGSLQNPPPPAA